MRKLHNLVNYEMVLERISVRKQAIETIEQRRTNH